MAAKPVINIITRTSGRPNYFKACQQSILSQTYPTDHIRLYVTFDDERDIDLEKGGYIPQYNNIYAAVEVTPQKRRNQVHFPFHAYLNEVMTEQLGEDESVSGWIMILDDDNELAKPESLAILAKRIQDDGNDSQKLYIWKCQQPQRVVPSQMTFGKTPKPGDIHISCFAFHVSQINLFRMEEKKGAEADVIAKLFNQLHGVWIDDILTIAHESGNGTRQDVDVVPKIALTSESGEKKKITLKPITPLKINAPDLKKLTPSLKSTIVDTDSAEVVQVTLPKLKSKLTIAPLPASLPAVTEGENEGTDNEDEEEIADEEGDDINAEDEEEIGNEEPITQPETKLNKPTPTPPNTQVANETEIKTLDGDTLGPETTQLLIRLVNLLKTGRRVYILDENNMKKLGKCVFDALSCVDMEDKLVSVLETNLFERKTQELKTKVTQASISPQPQVNSPPIRQSNRVLSESKSDSVTYNRTKSTSLPLALPSESDSDSEFIDAIYILTDSDRSKNMVLDRNLKILSKTKFEIEMVNCKDMNLYNYQKHLREILKTAKGKGQRRIMILNGNDLLSHKFVELYEKQLAKITGDCYLWFLGNFKETSPRDILTSEFDLDDYLFLYDDIVKAKYTTQDKAHLHWKSYGHREGRYAKITSLNDALNPVNNNYGFVVSAEIYDTLIELIDKQGPRDCKDVLSIVQTNLVDNKTVWCSRPDLIIPAFPNANNHNKNAQIAQKGGCYYNFYKL